MGALGSKEWAEVYNNGSPGSPDENPVVGRPAPKGRVLRVDPRSITDDVERTPIQIDKTPDRDSSGTPRGPKSRLDRVKMTMDPRSPSGLPRTPILVQELKGASDDKPEFAPEHNIGAIPSRGSVAGQIRNAAPVAKLDLDVNEDEDGENQKPETSGASGRSLPMAMNPDLEKECRSPLLIVEDTKDDAAGSQFRFGKQRSRTPLSSLASDSNTETQETVEILKNVRLDVEGSSPDQNTSLVI